MPDELGHRTLTVVEKRPLDVDAWLAEHPGASLDDFRASVPAEVVSLEDNLIVDVGATAIWQLVTATGGTAFSNANATIGVGDSSTAEAANQTDLQAATNKLRKAMDASYPQVSGRSATWRATFGGSDANFAWNEWGVFNAASGGTMLNRKVQSLGTKASGTTWTITVTITLN